ncbi:hypothetical protein ACB098_11G033500 [Castanea mollissima]
MAEVTLIEVVEGVIGKSGSLADENGLRWDVKDELEKLRNRCASIQAVVLDVEEQQAWNPQLSEWVRKLKDAFFQADDLLEEFSDEVSRREMLCQSQKKIKKTKEVFISFSELNYLAYDLKMSRKIKAIRERLDDIADDRMVVDVVERLVHTHFLNRDTETYYFVRDGDVIGRENDKKNIIGILKNPNVNVKENVVNVEENVAVLPMVGMKGLGKTTLAQFIFNDKEITDYFEIRLWVCVSDNFDVRIIVEEILAFTRGKKTKNLEMSVLVNDLQEEIAGKRFLLVLDDVWNYDYEKWLELKELLQSGASGSRILLTTREEKVAMTTQTIEPYFLRGLDKHTSWSLFKKKAFAEGQEPKNLRIKEIGMEIVEKCRGVPLALKTIGSLLYFRNLVEWLSFKNGGLSKVDPGKTSVLSTLKLSYDNLPLHLKRCFAYCSLFPKDYKINKQTLIKLWMAQMFIKLSTQNQRLEDIGNEYFEELLSRSFFQEVEEDKWFQEVEEDKWGNISFKIHGLMHDLLILIAGQESTIAGINGEHIDAQTRHLSLGFHLGSLSLTTLSFQTSNLRTFLLCGQHLGEHANGLNESTCDAFVSRSKFLRVLDLHETGIKIVPSSIGKLNHLRYLDLSNNRHIKRLPDSLSDLQDLQTLKLSGCVQLKELPREISKLVNLLFLEIDGCRGLTHMPCGLGQLTNLQTLSRFVMSKDTSSVSTHDGELKELNRLNGELKELNKLNDLKGMLEIINLRHGKDATSEYEAANLKEKRHLQALGFHWIEDEVDEEDVVFDETSLEALQPDPKLKFLSLYGYRGVRFPNWLSSLTNLVEFALFGCEKWQYLLPLEQFPSLKVLELDSLPALEYISNSDEFSNFSFLPSLDELKLKYCPNLKEWWRRRRDPMKELNDDNDNYVGITKATTSIAESHLLPSFPWLSKLCIRGCPQLTSMPLFPSLEKLELYYCSFRPMEQTARMAAETVASTSSYTPDTSSFAPLSKLKSLEIGRMEEPLPEECMQNLISLNFLRIYECRGPLLQGIRHLTALKQLHICSSEVFDLSNGWNGMEWQKLTSLSSLWLFHLLKLESLPVGLQHVTSLRKLTIDHCPCLMAIPGWICSLTSLEILEILECPNVISLPVEISRLTSLHTLKIC